MQTRGGNATTLIKLKKTPPHAKRGEGVIHRLGASTPLSPRRRCRRRFLVPTTSPSPCRPWPYCSPFSHREQLLAAAVRGAVVVVVAVLILVFLSSSSRRRSRTVGLCPSFCCHPPPRCCCCWCARFLPWPRCSPSPSRKPLLGVAVGRRRHVLSPAIHPRTVAVGHCFPPSFLLCSPFPPREQLLAAAVGGAVVVSARPCHSSSHCPLRAGARSGDVGVGERRLVFRQLGERFLPHGYPTSLGSLIPPMQFHILYTWGGRDGAGTALVVKKL